MALITKASMDLLARHGVEVLPDLLALYDPADRSASGMGLLVAAATATRDLDVLSAMLSKGFRIQPEFMFSEVANWVGAKLLDDLAHLDFAKCCEGSPALAIMRWPLCSSKSGLILRELPKVDEIPDEAFSEFFKWSAPRLVGLPAKPGREGDAGFKFGPSEIESLLLQATQAIDIVSRNPMASVACLSWTAGPECRAYVKKALRFRKDMLPFGDKDRGAFMELPELLEKWAMMADANAVASISGALSGKSIPVGKPVRI